MNKRTTTIILLFVIAFLFLTPLMLYFFNEQTIYELSIPNADTVKNIKLTNNNTSIFIDDNNSIEEFINSFSNVNTITKKVSVQDWPVNTSQELSILFSFKDEQKQPFLIYVYQKKHNYYIEQPYNGIYPISKSQYEFFISYLS